ncbi:MAG: flagellar assembly protein FliH [Spirochaetaceae bacterium]
MAKNVFRAGEISIFDGKVFVTGPESPAEAPQPVESEEPEEYSGPTVEDIRREAEEFRAKWEAEREQMIQEAREEADRIIKEAENQAFEEVKAKNDEAATIRQEAEEEAQRIKEEAQAEAERFVSEAREKAGETEKEAYDRGVEQGEEKGFASGEGEVNRLIDRLHVILNKAIERRNEIIEESESQIIHLVLEIAKKVVKVISENQRNVVVNNVVQALRKLKQKSDVIIRVNFQDVKMVSSHTEQITSMVERAGNITVAEDSSVDPGGAIIETDFGQIDARISSQLREIEDRIVELAPIKSNPKMQE